MSRRDTASILLLVALGTSALALAVVLAINRCLCEIAVVGIIVVLEILRLEHEEKRRGK